jgi:hypothetical protein
VALSGNCPCTTPILFCMIAVESDLAPLFADPRLRRHVLGGTRQSPKVITGVHYAPMGRAPINCKLVRRDRPWKNGLYRAEIYGLGSDGRYHPKGVASTMFPDEWSGSEVFAAGRAAMKDAIRRGDFNVKTGRWNGVAFGVWNSQVHRYHISGYADFRDRKVTRVRTFFPAKSRSADRGGREL